MNYISGILYLATTDQYYCRIAVAFDEAHVSVGMYPLFALYKHHNVLVCMPCAHFAYTSQLIHVYDTCTIRIRDKFSDFCKRNVHISICTSILI